MWQVTNVANEVKSREKLRRAIGLRMAPDIAGRRLHLRSSIRISDADYERNKPYIELLIKQGVAEVKHLNPDVPLEPREVVANLTGIIEKVEFTSESDAVPQVDAPALAAMPAVPDTASTVIVPEAAAVMSDELAPPQDDVPVVAAAPEPPPPAPVVAAPAPQPQQPSSQPSQPPSKGRRWR